MTQPERVARPRGRPRNADGRATAERLLAAAAAVCAESGFERAGLAAIAERAGVSPTAVYNHYDSREDLLYAAAVRAIDEITEVAASVAGEGGDLRAIAGAYLRPEMAQSRRLIVELELASSRDGRLGELFGQWHRRTAEQVGEVLPEADTSRGARVKVLFLFLLGLCHLENLGTIEAEGPEVAELAERVLGSIVDG